MIIIDAIIFTFLNLFDKLDFKLSKSLSGTFRIKGTPESAALGIFSAISSLTICVLLIPFIDKIAIMLTVVLFFVISHIVDKHYEDKYTELESRVNNTIFKKPLYRRIMAIIYALLPVVIAIMFRQLIAK
jgi:uncharacterized membrane protein